VQFRIVHAVAAIALVACIALPAVADDSGIPDVTRVQSMAPYETHRVTPGLPTSTLLPDERDEPVRFLALVGPAAAIAALTILGLTLSIRALRHDMRQRRIVYRR
jgi:hypothetical protein